MSSPREPAQTHARPARRPKTKVGEARYRCKKKIHNHCKWVGHVDPLNIVIVSTILVTPVVGAGLLLIAFLIVAFVLLIILW